MFNQEKMGQSSPQESLPQQEKPPEGVDIQIKSLASENHPDRIEQAPTPKPVERREEAQLRKGDIVRIQRSSGEIEFGWKIFGFDKKTGNALVEKVEKGEILEKQVKLKDINPSERKISISEAKDFMELFKAIEATGGLQGSKKFYEVAELKHTVNRVRTGELPLSTLTQTGGLRERVKDLLK